MIKDVNNRYGLKIENTHKPRKSSKRDLIRQLENRNRIRRANDISDWSRALNDAERRDDPDRTLLIEIYKNMEIDGHVKGITTTIKNKIKAKDFWLVDSQGEPDEEAKALFERKWFGKYSDWSVESKTHGFSLIQLNNPVDGAFNDMELIDREFVIPDLGIVKRDITKFSGDAAHWNYKEGSLKDWFVFIGEDKSLGLFNNIAPQVISKKHMLSALWQFVEIFGQPIRIGKTDIDDNDQKRNMIDMLGQMGRAPWGVFSSEDEIELIESAKGNAAVFTDPIELANKEISKGITGITGLFDEMSLVGSAQIQENILNDLMLSYTSDMKHDINDDLIPRMQKHAGFGDRTFVWKADERLTTLEKVDAIVDLSLHYKISADEVKDATGIEVEEKVIEEPLVQSPSVAASVKALYDTFKLK